MQGFCRFAESRTPYRLLRRQLLLEQLSYSVFQARISGEHREQFGEEFPE
jgi:hypothetical protein